MYIVSAENIHVCRLIVHIKQRKSGYYIYTLIALNVYIYIYIHIYIYTIIYK